MSSYDMDCGIAERHCHTGEIVEGYFIEYWCPSATVWMDERTKETFDRKCTCETPHMRARIQHTMTEIIEILPSKDKNAQDEFLVWLGENIKEHYLYYLVHGEEAYLKWTSEDERWTESSFEGPPGSDWDSPSDG